MTIFRCKVLIAAFFASAFVADANARQLRGVSCGNIDPGEERACVSRRVDAKERRLKAVYARAFAAVQRNAAKYQRSDSRSSVRYLVHSQAAWKQLVANDCKVRSAFGGSSNPSISEREVDCYEDALDERLQFLGELADGSFGAR